MLFFGQNHECFSLAMFAILVFFSRILQTTSGRYFWDCDEEGEVFIPPLDGDVSSFNPMKVCLCSIVEAAMSSCLVHAVQAGCGKCLRVVGVRSGVRLDYE